MSTLFYFRGFMFTVYGLHPEFGPVSSRSWPLRPVVWGVFCLSFPNFLSGVRSSVWRKSPIHRLVRRSRHRTLWRVFDSFGCRSISSLGLGPVYRPSSLRVLLPTKRLLYSPSITRYDPFSNVELRSPYTRLGWRRKFLSHLNPESLILSLVL